MYKLKNEHDQVAVLVSKGYGAGWSTWGAPESCLDGEIAQAILDGRPDQEISEIAERNWPGQYQGGLGDCVVEWVAEGQPFEIDEYDGAESLREIYIGDFLVA